MVDINKINETPKALGGVTQKTPKEQATEEFKNALNQAMDSRGKTGEAHRLEEIASTRPIMAGSPAVVTGEAEKLLDILENYTNQLESPRASLKQIATVVDKMTAQADALLSEAKNLGSNHLELKKIATQTVITAQTESLKFQRGDYLS